jgi:ATP-binding protein involved in chromosome partitioning
VNQVLDLAAVNQALSLVIDPNTGHDFVSSRSARNIRIDGSDGGASVSLDVELGYPAASQIELIRNLIATALKKAGAADVQIAVSTKIVPHTVQRGLKVMPNVRNIVAIYSGKGGVGKSTVAVNLALALSAEGARVGMLDADIYGPSQTMMMAVSGQPESLDGKTMEPKENFGVQVNSIGLLVGQDTPMVWRGPMVTNALQQLLMQTNWKDLDYLVVDMPPGTGDIQLTLAQQVPVTGAVIVTTPQEIALLDAMKGLKMFEKVGVPILGIVENMAVHLCSQCGHAEHIFGSGGAERMSREYDVEVLGSLPLDIRIREQTDSGRPTVVAEPEGPLAVQFKAIARRVAIKISERAKDLSSKMPTIKVSKT